MSEKIAIKKLTASDLTFFEWQFRNHNAGNQKAINLNADVFIQQLYPALPEIALSRGGRIPIDLYIYGPGLSGEYNLQRKIIKFGTYKNWRLDGEFIYNPEDNPERFNILVPGDFVLFDFIGEAGYPTLIRAFFIAQGLDEDRQLHQIINTHLGDLKMLSITVEGLEQIIEQAQSPDDHPINGLILEEAVEDASFGGVGGIRRLLSSGARRRISQEELQNARQNAESIGYLGETFINAYLVTQKNNGEIRDFKWESEENAISPFDFWKITQEEERVLIEVKSTKGDFNRKIHIAMSELWKMANSEDLYIIYRVYKIDESNAKLQISEDVRDFGRNIIDIFENLPEGVIPDSISIPPSILNFQDEIDITLPQENIEE